MLRRPISAAFAAAVLLGLPMQPALAQVDGESETPGVACPAGAVAGQANKPNWDTFFECNGSGNWQRGPYFFGATADTCDSNHAGMVQWTGSVMEYCNGSAWTQFEPVQSTPVETAPAGSGYFVLSAGTYNGNLGGLAGADALCLTDLTTNTGWQGYATANSKGQLVATKVHAFLCGNNTTCNNLMPLTSYYFASAGNSAAGGASFTTDSTGAGPNDSNDWAAANYFSGTYAYWANRTANTNTAWGLTSPGTADCNFGGQVWATSSSSSPGDTGTSAGTTSVRWSNNSTLCNVTVNLICFVNP